MKDAAEQLDETKFIEWVDKIGGDYGVKNPEPLRTCFVKLLARGLTMDEAGEIINIAYYTGASNFGGG